MEVDRRWWSKRELSKWERASSCPDPAVMDIRTAMTRG